MTMRDITSSPVSVKILVVSMLAAASGTWAVAFAWFEQKNATNHLIEEVVALRRDLKQARIEQWTYAEAKTAVDKFSEWNPTLKVPDIRAIRRDIQN